MQNTEESLTNQENRISFNGITTTATVTPIPSTSISLPTNSNGGVGGIERNKVKVSANEIPEVSSDPSGGNGLEGEGRRRSSVISGYLTLSPENPLRIFSISILTSWVYYAVISLSICAFLASTILEFLNPGIILHVSRWALLTTLGLEILLKCFARGVCGKFAYLRLSWDWVDLTSFILLFLSVITEKVDFLVCSVILFKFIPMHTGSINALVFLSSCAKNLVPVLSYGLIVLWIAAFLFFTLFLKYQPTDLTKWPSSFLIQSNDSSNFSLGLTCLPTRFRSLSGSFIQTLEMIMLQETETLSLNYTISEETDSLSSSCQYTAYLVSLIETFVHLFGTLPLILTTLSVLSHLFQKQKPVNCSSPVNENEPDGDFYERRRQSESVERHRRTEESIFAKCTGIFFNWDYFCCFAALQRKIGPGAGILLNSRKFKVFLVVLICSDLASMIVMMILGNIDFSPAFPTLWLITQGYVQVCFIIYTLEAVLRWISTSSEDYWQTAWPPFDFGVVFAYWILFILWHVLEKTLNYQFNYFVLAGILMVRMLKIVPYWKGLEQTLRFLLLSSLRNRFNLLVIFICSLSSVLFKQGLYAFEGTLKNGDLISSEFSEDFHTFFDFFFLTLAFFFCCVFLITFEGQIYSLFKNPPPFPSDKVSSTLPPANLRNPSITVFLSSCSNDQSQDDITFDELRRPSEQHLLSSSTSRSFIPSPISVMSVPNGKFPSSPSASSNGVFSPTETRSSLLSPSSDVLSPLLSLPPQFSSNGGLNGHANHLLHPSYSPGVSSELNEGMLSSSRTASRRDSYLDIYRQASLEDVFNLISSVLIILATVNMVLDGESEMNWQTLHFGSSLWLELILVLGIGAHIAFKTRLKRFSRDTFLQIATIVDLINILAVSVEIFSSGMGWMPKGNESGALSVFLHCAKIISAMRGLLLLSRVPWLQCISSGICYVLWKSMKIIGAILYLWIIFVFTSIGVQNLVKIITTGQSETNQIVNQMPSNSSNFTTEFLSTNETDRITPSELITTTPMTVTNTNGAEEWLFRPILFSVMLILFLLSIAVLLGFLRHKLGSLYQRQQLTQKFMTRSQNSAWLSSNSLKIAQKKSRTSGDYSLTPYSSISRQMSTSFLEYPPPTQGFEEELFAILPPSEPALPKPTKGICVPMLYFVANHKNFDVIVMSVIIFDAIGITFESFATSERWLILRRHYPAYMLFWYGMEISSKLAGNGWRFFKSYWNIFDCVIITVCTIDFFVALFIQSWVVLLIQNLRFLRILRIFQFYPFTSRTEIIQQFYKIALSPNSILFYPFLNFSLFYFFVHLAFLAFNIKTSLKSSPVTSPWPISASPIDTLLSIPKLFEQFTLDRIFLAFGQILFALTKLSAVFLLSFILISFLTQWLSENDKEIEKQERKISRSHSFLPHQEECEREEGQVEVEESKGLDFEETSFRRPCLSRQETIEIETPSCSTALLPAPKPSTSSVLIDKPVEGEGPVDGGEVKPSNLYQTKTITSSEDINGCKVFFVEAMITTV